MFSETSNYKLCIKPDTSLHRDTAGQERYETITTQYYRRAQVSHGAIQPYAPKNLFLGMALN